MAQASPPAIAQGAWPVGRIGLGLWIVLVTTAAFLYAPPAKGFQNEALARMLFFHVPNSIVGMVVSVLSAWFAIRYLMTRRWIDDARSKSLASQALLFWLLTTITGSAFAKVQWGAYWNWDPKETAAFVLVLIYMAYFALRAGVPDMDKQAVIGAAYTLFAAVMMPLLTYVLPNATPDTLHPKGVIFSMSGMDSQYKLVFWSAVIGFLGLSAWIYAVQIRAERIARALDVKFRTAAEA